jgi:signal peptidase I
MNRHSATRGRRVSRLGTVMIVAASLLLALIALGVLSGNYQIRPVLSGSMRPGLPVGGVVITHRVPLDDIKVRDVIVFTRPGNPSEMVVHRVIEIHRDGATVTARTQGDANDAPDPWTLNLHGNTAYRAIYTLPLIGYPAVWLHNVNGNHILAAIAGLALLIAAASTWRTDRRRARSAEPAEGPAADEAVADEADADDVMGELIPLSREP